MGKQRRGILLTCGGEGERAEPGLVTAGGRCKEDKGKERSSGYFEEVEGERDWHTAGERKESVCE